MSNPFLSALLQDVPPAMANRLLAMYAAILVQTRCPNEASILLSSALNSRRLARG